MRCYRVCDVNGITDCWVANQASAKARRLELLEEGRSRGIVPDLVSEERAKLQCRFEVEEIPDGKDELLAWINTRL